ncbi:unnamed protein product [Rhodiola kirilowii]
MKYVRMFHICRNLVGEDLDPLSLRELQNLEHELENSLKHIRLKKNQFMNQSIAEMHKKDRAMQEQNKLLGKKMKEREKALAEEQGQLDHQSHDGSPPPPIQTSLQPIIQLFDVNMYAFLIFLMLFERCLLGQCIVIR